MFANILKNINYMINFFPILHLNIVKNHYQASIKEFGLEAFCPGFVFHCPANLKSVTLWLSSTGGCPLEPDCPPEEILPLQV